MSSLMFWGTLVGGLAFVVTWAWLLRDCERLRRQRMLDDTPRSMPEAQDAYNRQRAALVDALSITVGVDMAKPGADRIDTAFVTKGPPDDLRPRQRWSYANNRWLPVFYV